MPEDLEALVRRARFGQPLHCDAETAKALIPRLATALEWASKNQGREQAAALLAAIQDLERRAAQ